MISTSPYSQRKLEFLRHFETAGDELDRPGKYNAAYREDDRKFMGFPIPPGKRVLELGCGRGQLLVLLRRWRRFQRYDHCQGHRAASRSAFCPRRCEDPATLSGIEGTSNVSRVSALISRPYLDRPKSHIASSGSTHVTSKPSCFAAYPKKPLALPISNALLRKFPLLTLLERGGDGSA